MKPEDFFTSYSFIFYFQEVEREDTNVTNYISRAIGIITNVSIKFSRFLITAYFSRR